MLNKEKYAKEIIDIVCSGHNIGKQNGHLCSCANVKCSDCEFNKYNTYCNEEFAKWANSEYKKREIDWNKVPVDTPIYVWDDNGDNIIYKRKRHFAEYDADIDKIFAFTDGQTSWTSEQDMIPWNNAEIKEGIDCSEWYKEED